MLNFSIMSLNEDHIDQICDDIVYQVTSKIATMPLFSFTLTPEGIPTIDKADLLCNTYEKYLLYPISSSTIYLRSIGVAR